MDFRPKKERREIWGIIFLCVLAFVFVSLISYYPLDPSLNSVSSTQEVHNLAGLVGSYTSDILFQTFGLSAFTLLFPLLIIMISCFFPYAIARKGVKFLGFFLLLIFSTSLFSLIFKTIPYHNQNLLAGGMMGHGITSFLLPYFNQVGAYILMLGGLLITLILALNLSFVSILKFLGLGSLRLLSIFSIFKSFKLPKFKKPSLPMFSTPVIAQAQLAKSPKKDSPYSDEPILIDDFEEDPIIDKTKPPPLPKAIPSSSEGIEFADEPIPQPPPVIVEPSTALKSPIKKKDFSQRLSIDFLKPQGNFKLPKIDLLSDPPQENLTIDKETLFKNSKILEQKLRDFNIEGRVAEVRPGPVITVYEFEPAPGIKVSKIVNLSDDLSLALSALSVRIVAPIPGKSVVGIELPNDRRQLVALKEILLNNEFKSLKYRLPLALGKTISGDPMISDLARMPHLLVAGATGSGKSVFINSIICSFLFRYTPDQLRFLFIDPKMLELSLYENIPHLLLPVVTDPKKAALALKWAVEEMDRRYLLMTRLGVRNIDSYNKKLEDTPEEDLETLWKQFSPEEESTKPIDLPDKLPYIIIIIDELADLMMVASKDVELSVARLAQMARASGIHLLLATQRPSVDVLTGLIKANFPARISFQVSSKIDSRTILDCSGAEKLLGSGDMLFLPPGTARVMRVHGAYVADQDIKQLVQFLRGQGKPQYNEEILEKRYDESDVEFDEEDTELYEEAVELVRQCRFASISMIQRRLRIGYNRAARMIEQMEAEGIVGPADGAKPREVLIRKE